LPNAQTMPPEAETKRIWQDMLAWIQRNVPRHGAVPTKQLATTAR
jgi:murein peptide amidase A